MAGVGEAKMRRRERVTRGRFSAADRVTGVD